MAQTSARILIANIGSTSFKYRLFDMNGPLVLAQGRIERIGQEGSACPNYEAALATCMDAIVGPGKALRSTAELAGIGFKAVNAGTISGTRRIDDNVLAAMEEFSFHAPAHNPPYIAAMRLLADKLPQIPLVAAFETDFHATIPQCNQLYAIPYQWSESLCVRRWGFHGASHRYIAGRTAELLGRTDLRIISCHLGGSSSLCAIRNGQSVATTMGMSPQSGLPQNNRVGDFDAFALPRIMQQSGKSLAEVLSILANQSGLLGVSGVSTDYRDIAEAAGNGNARAKLALDIYAASVRHYLGAYLVELGGADAIVFTGGIGENRNDLRTAVCHNLAELGIALDPVANQEARGEVSIHASQSRVQIWVMPTNEELVVARLAAKLLKGSPSRAPAEMVAGKGRGEGKE
jgi:acetate kinase